MSSRAALWLLGAVVALATTLGLQGFAGGTLAQVEDRVTDAVWRFSADRALERRLVIVDIDERSLREQGPWPWPRELQARLMSRLAEAGVQRQVWDVVFAGASPVSSTGSPALARAIAQTDPVLAQVFALGGDPSSGSPALQEGQLAGATAGLACLPGVMPVAAGYLANHPSVLPADTRLAVGHITPTLSGDGVLRRLPAFICHEGQAYPALALASLQGAGANSHAPDWQLERGSLWQAAWMLRSGHTALAPVPLSADGQLPLAWRQRPEGYISLSASDVLAGRIPAGLGQGSWALVGSTAFGLNDRIATPFNEAAPGLLAHAQLITAVLDGRVPYTPRAQWLLQAGFLVVGLALLGGLLAWRSRAAVWLPFVGLAFVPVLALAHAALLLGAGWLVGWAAPALGIFLGGSALGAVAHARSRLDRDRLYRHLASYLPAPVAAALVGQGPSGLIEARTQQVSVMFADVRNFSAYCEARPPAEAAAVLHTFFATATRVVHAHGGVIEALQGDSVIATWHAEGPIEAPINAARALMAAMGGALPDPAPDGLEPLALGIGLESGPAMTGSIGPQDRRTHMVMGRTVTIASRLVAMTADLAHPILVGEGMAAQLGGVQRLRSLGTFMLDGLRVPHHVYAWPLGSGGTAAPAPGLGPASQASALAAAPSAPSETHAQRPLH